MSKWIPVEERLPEQDGYYLVYRRLGSCGWCDIVKFAKDGRKIHRHFFQNDWENVWTSYDDEWGYSVLGNITHWMPLPEPPEMKGENNG